MLDLKAVDRYRIIGKILRGDKHDIRLRIIHHILETPNEKSYLTELSGTLGITKQTLLLHLAHLVHEKILTFEYETVPVGQEHRPVVIKWYRVRKGYEWLGETELAKETSK